jgi:hypothetical protein
MEFRKPYLRTFLAGAVWFSAIGIKIVLRHPGPWSSYHQFIMLAVAWVITALLLGVAVTQLRFLRSWWGVGLGTVAGSLVVLRVMLFTAEPFYGPPAPPKFRSTAEMMVYFATDATKWVKKDRGIDLDYSLDSIKIIDEELLRVSKEIDKANPQRGTFGLCLGYGSYVGEVLRRRNGGSWGVDHSNAGPPSYPLTAGSNTVMFPVDWCWQRLTRSNAESLFVKAITFAQPQSTYHRTPD